MTVIHTIDLTVWRRNEPERQLLVQPGSGGIGGANGAGTEVPPEHLLIMDAGTDAGREGSYAGNRNPRPHYAVTGILGPTNAVTEILDPVHVGLGGTRPEFLLTTRCIRVRIRRTWLVPSLELPVDVARTYVENFWKSGGVQG